MWIKSDTYPVMDGEPHLGTVVETELMEDEGEGLAILITYMADQQEVPRTFIAIDDYSDESIELIINDYLDNSQIAILEGAFIHDSEWTETQLYFLIELGDNDAYARSNTDEDTKPV